MSTDCNYEESCAGAAGCRPLCPEDEGDPSSPCGRGAVCQVFRAHSVLCRCPDGQDGDPYVGCQSES